MGEPFDPYYTWLGISKADQPPHHYRLLGIDLFEPSGDVICHAADRQMAHLRTFQAGKHGAESQKLLNEVAAARVTLLNSQKKAAYDDGLRQALAVPDTGAREESSSNLRLQAELAEIAAASHHLPARQQRPKTPIWAWAVMAAMIAPVAFGILWFASRRPPEIAQREPEKTSNTASVPESPKSKPESPVAKKVEVAAPPAIRGEKAAPKPTAAMGPSTEIPAAAASNVPGPTAGTPAVSGPPATTVPSEPPGGSPSTKPSTSPTTMPLQEMPKQPEAAAGPRQAPETSASRQKDDKPTSMPSGPLVAANRQPVPSEDLLAEAMKAAQEVYGAEYEKARTAVARQVLAKKVLAAGLATQGSLAQRFVLLRLARDVAVKGEDDKLAFAAIDGIRETFEIDLAAMKADVLAALAKTVKTQSAHKVITEKAVVLAEETLAADSLTTAEEMARLALAESAKAKDKELGGRARMLVKDVQEAAKAAITVEAAQQALKKSPNDPDANLVIGRYQCFVKGDWAKGLKLLSIGSDRKLADLAARDLAGSGVSTEQIELAEAWSEQSRTMQGESRLRCAARALYWSRQALLGSDLDRVQKARIEKQFTVLKVPEKYLLPPDIGIPDPSTVPVGEVRRFTVTGNIDAMAVAPTGRSCLVGGTSRQVALVDLSTGRCLAQWPCTEEGAMGVDISPDGRLGAWGGRDGVLEVVDLTTRQKIAGISVPGWVFTPVFMPDGKSIICGSGKGVHLYDLETKREVRPLKGTGGWVEGLSVSSDGRYALTGSTDKTIRLIEISSGRELLACREGMGHVRRTALSSDDRTGFCSGHDKMVHMWDLSTGREVGRLVGHEEAIYGLAVSGGYVLSGSADKTVRLWNIKSGKVVAQWELAKGVSCVRFLPDRRFAVAGTGSEIVLFRLPIALHGT